MKLSIEWHRNNLSHGKESDPHFGTEHENHYAVLVVEDDMDKIFLQMPDGIYDRDSYDLLEKLVAKFKSFPSY